MARHPAGDGLSAAAAARPGCVPASPALATNEVDLTYGFVQSSTNCFDGAIHPPRLRARRSVVAERTAMQAGGPVPCTSEPAVHGGAAAVGAGGSRVALDTSGYVYLPAVTSAQQAACAAEEVDKAFAREIAARGDAYSRINSEREQVKLGREHDKLPQGVRGLVRRLEERLQDLCPEEHGPLMDVYALRTAGAETNAEARAPQEWHLDDYSKFPVAAVILRGQGATEFHHGPYADFANGAPGESTLKAWTEDWRLYKRQLWCSQSEEEQRHWTERLRAAGLLSEDGKRCDWDRPAVPAISCAAGDGAIFWSNKVHRGPGTQPGEERVVLFVSWNRHRQGRRARNAPSETDYSYYAEHFEPKLKLSKRAERSSKRKCLRH